MCPSIQKYLRVLFRFRCRQCQTVGPQGQKILIEIEHCRFDSPPSLGHLHVPSGAIEISTLDELETRQHSLSYGYTVRSESLTKTPSYHDARLLNARGIEPVRRKNKNEGMDLAREWTDLLFLVIVAAQNSINIVQ
jgi:hypothetical protein